jgi:hypothetical protein
VTPLALQAGSGDTTLTATGSGFVPGTVLQWNGQSLATTVLSPTQLTALVPSTLLQAAGTATLTALAPGSPHPSAPQALFVTLTATGTTEYDAAAGSSGQVVVVVGGSGANTPGSITSTGQIGSGAAGAETGSSPGSDQSGLETTLFAADPGPAASDPSWQVLQPSTDSQGCLELLVTATSSPSLADLGGAWFRTGHGIAAGAGNRTGSTTTSSPPTTSALYFDVHRAAGSSFGSVTIRDCVSGATQLLWDAAALVPLAAGTNTIALPRLGALTTLDGVVASVAGQLGAGRVSEAAVYRDGRYQVLVPGYGGSGSVTPSSGVVLVSRSGGTWRVAGASAGSGQVVALEQGWTLVGAPYPPSGLESTTIAQEVASCGPAVIAASSGGTLETWTAQTPRAFLIPATAGFWIECASPLSWTPF